MQPSSTSAHVSSRSRVTRTTCRAMNRKKRPTIGRASVLSATGSTPHAAIFQSMRLGAMAASTGIDSLRRRLGVLESIACPVVVVR